VRFQPALTARRQADRQKSREAVEALKTSEGWQRWLRSRRHFHRYSLVILSGRSVVRCALGPLVTDMSLTGLEARR
jgi:hypothetical protein